MFHLFAYLASFVVAFTTIGLGLGTSYPPINQVAKPFLCQEGKLTAQTRYGPAQGRGRGLSLGNAVTKWTCEGPYGQKEEVDGFTVALYSGAIYGLGFYLLMAPIWFRRPKRPKAPATF